jgi:type VI secretion system protein ImpE
MSATELYKAGKLQEAVEAQIQEVKKAPADMGKRLFLFELLAFSGDWERARRQIDAIKYEQLELESAVAGYRKLLDAEDARRRLFRDGLKPRFFIDPSPQVELRLQAVNRLRENNQAEAAGLLQQANDVCAGLKGTLNGKPFVGLRDCDDQFAGVLEVMAQGGYFWVPLDQIESIAMKPPRFPRDLLWAPARVDLHEGASGEVFLPILYPGSAESADAEVKLGRRTDWKQGAPDGPTLGHGARLLLAGDNDAALLDCRELVLEAA